MRREMLNLQPEVEAPRLARMSVREWLAEEGLDEFVEGVQLVVSELVANAVIHTHTVLELSFSADDRSLEVSVSDQDPRLPPRRLDGVALSDGLLLERGRGLAIVDALADEWGVAETADGKRVWARWSARHPDRRRGPD